MEKIILRTVECINEFTGHIPIGTKGIVTVYLPEEKVFTVEFDSGKCIAFTGWTEDEFTSKFKCTMS